MVMVENKPRQFKAGIIMLCQLIIKPGLLPAWWHFICVLQQKVLNYTGISALILLNLYSTLECLSLSPEIQEVNMHLITYLKVDKGLSL